MPSNQIALNIVSPANLGLNTESAGSNLGPEWATVADNMVIDDAGRLASRNGYSYTTPLVSRVAEDVTVLHNLVTADGEQWISVAGDTLYELDGMVDITGSLSLTNSNLQFANLNSKVMGMAQGQEPVYYDPIDMPTFDTALSRILAWVATTGYSIGDVVQPTTSNGLYYVATTNGTTGGSEPTFPLVEEQSVVDGTVTWVAKKLPAGNALFTGYGRAWATDATNTVLHYSDLLIPYKFSGGSSGVVDMKAIWVHGMDDIVAINGFNGFLIVFGRNSILIFGGTEDPNNLTLVENIRGVGCIARDSVQHTGEDILFLSGSGVRSLARVIQEKSNPVGDETRNVRSFLYSLVDDSNDLTNIRSAYSEVDGAYLLLLPEFDKFFVLDTRLRLPDGTRRVTTWTSMGAKCAATTVDSKLHFGRSGGIAQYRGFLDGSDPIRVQYKSGWIPLDEEGRLYTLKRVDATIVAASNTGVTMKWGWDFSRSTCQESQTTNIIAGVSEYGIAEYGVAEYGILEDSFNVRIAPSGQGNSLRLEVNANVPNTDFRLQRLTIILKRGRFD